MKHALWTAIGVSPSGIVLAAQSKESRENCRVRLIADDPMWKEPIRFVRMKRFSKDKFRNGLAFKVLGWTEVIGGNNAALHKLC